MAGWNDPPKSTLQSGTPLSEVGVAGNATPAKLQGGTPTTDANGNVIAPAGVNLQQIGGVATQMATADSVALANVQEMSLGVYASGSINRLRSAADITDGNAGGTSLPIMPYLFNGTSFNMQRANLDNITLISASNVSTLQTSADQTNYNARGIIVILNITVIGTGNLITTIQAKGPAAVVYKTLLVSLAVSSATSAIYIVCPGVTEAANLKSGNPLPRTWNATVSGANGSTFTLEALLIN